MNEISQIKKNSLPSVFVTSFIHSCKRFNAGKEAGNKLESKMFEKFRRISPEAKSLIRHTTKSFDSLSVKRKGIYANMILKNNDIPGDPDALAKEFVKEITGMVSRLALEETKEPGLKERPGKVRLHAYGQDDVYPSQVHIFKINDLRTNDYIPFLNLHEYLPEEFQLECTGRREGEKIKWDCKRKRPPCAGNSIDNICLRVQEIQSGTSVIITGVNFFDINSKIWMRLKGTNSNFKKIEVFVYGDILTPVKKTENGHRRLIADSRVSDKIFFAIPINTTPGIYEFKVAIPNSSGFSGPGFGETLFSNLQYIEIVPPLTARFQISSERLHVRKETSGPGSDKPGIKINSIPFFPNLKIGSMQQQSFRFSNVDSGYVNETEMQRLLFSHTKPIAGVILSVIGHEIDSEDAYQQEITEWTEIFVELLKEQWDIILGSASAMAALKAISKAGFYGYIVIGCAILLTLAIDFFYSLWAPADLIIQDTLSYSVNDLGRMTSINIPMLQADTNKTIYTVADDIGVRLMYNDKVPYEYTEERGYLSASQNSWYNIKFRYTRLA